MSREAGHTAAATTTLRLALQTLQKGKSMQAEQLCPLRKESRRDSRNGSAGSWSCGCKLPKWQCLWRREEEECRKKDGGTGEEVLGTGPYRSPRREVVAVVAAPCMPCLCLCCRWAGHCSSPHSHSPQGHWPPRRPSQGLRPEERALPQPPLGGQAPAASGPSGLP